ncbi:MAG: MutS2/Smr-associated SH3 domain-containing protein [Planctomycetota bacterium]
MDRHTLEKLEFDRIRHLLASYAQCALGRDLASRIQPSRRISQVHHWLEQGKQFGAWVELHGLPPFGGIRDIREHVRRAVPPANLEPEDFADLAATLVGIGHVRAYLKDAGQDFPLLAALGDRLGDFQSIADHIGRVIDGRGKVRDHASDRLWRLRRNIDEVRQQTRAVFQRLLKQSSILKLLQYPNATFHADRMVLPLKAEQRGRLPGIVHRSSDSGQTVFVEPAEAVELNNTRINLLQAEREEIGRILWELTHIVHLNQKEILRTLETTAVIDLLTAKTKFAQRYGMHNVEINEKQQLLLRRARNPILLAAYEEDQEDAAAPHEVVPIDVRLGDDFDVMIITGPNTGGKTAALKTVGLMAVMTQSGLPIPADEGSTLPVFEEVWIDVGDEQSLVQSLSTFSAHLSQILHILHKARQSTLVLLDELGAGTDPDEGAAIGRAVIEHLLGSHCLAMVTTHLGSLKATGFELKRVDNASVLFDMQTLKPLYELRIGEPGNSNAIAIASRLGMPRKLVHTARRHLAGGHRSLTRAIAGTLAARRSAERAMREADKARQDAARRALTAFDQEKSLHREREAYKAWVHRVINLKPGDKVRVRNFDAPGRVVHIRLEKQQVSVDLGQMQVDVALADLILDAAAPGKP